MSWHMLDTHLLVWYITGDKRLSKDIRYDLDYYQRRFCVSVETLKEIVLLRALKKIDTRLTLEYVFRILSERAIKVINIERSHLLQYEELPPLRDPVSGIDHRDPVDRMIIAQSISTGYPLISADHIFPHYVVHGLDLIVN